MKLRYGLITLIVLMGCSKPKTNESQSITNDKADSAESVLLTNDPSDTLCYIGYIQKFEDNNSFYTDLYFADNFNYDLYEELARMGDSVVFKDEETQRTRVEIEKVKQYFNLTGLKSINIYNRENLKLTAGRLSHIEYVEDMIETRFVAVFEVDHPNISDHLFCIGNLNDSLNKIYFYSHEDEKLKSELVSYLKLNTDHIWSIRHYKLDNQAIYSTVSADTTAYIIQTMDKTHNMLYKSNSSEAIGELTMISKKINGRQILLADCGMPETDMTWTSVLIFNGTTYEASKDHRISDN